MIEAIPRCLRTQHLLLHNAERLELLALDMRAIAAGNGPLPSDLEAAPIINSWELSWRPMTTMVGTLVGHPRLMNGAVHTTEVWAIDPQRRWARTLSRYYALGMMRSVPPHD